MAQGLKPKGRGPSGTAKAVPFPKETPASLALSNQSPANYNPEAERRWTESIPSQTHFDGPDDCGTTLPAAGWTCRM
jgi:hypothetical protein